MANFRYISDLPTEGAQASQGPCYQAPQAIVISDF